MSKNKSVEALRKLGFNVDAPQCQYCNKYQNEDTDKNDPKCLRCCAKGLDEETKATWLNVSCQNCDKDFYASPNKEEGELFDCPFCECTHTAVPEQCVDSELNWYPFAENKNNRPTSFEDDHGACFNCVNDVTNEDLVCTCWRLEFNPDGETFDERCRR
ncbi:hypothetical protein [Vibrio crassostreae]|uniref:hypothetical protein n=1 Tax=Vibrio crassostreae TaxID=246167 RepID=UPI001B314F5F|nr:hypothetical protein [Vibrio crassostreae]